MAVDTLNRIAQTEQATLMEERNLEELGKQIDQVFKDLADGDYEKATISAEAMLPEVEHTQQLDDFYKERKTEFDQVEQKIQDEEKLSKIREIKVAQLMELVQRIQNEPDSEQEMRNVIRKLFPKTPLITKSGKLTVIGYSNNKIMIEGFPYYIILEEEKLEQAIKLRLQLQQQQVTIQGLALLYKNYQDQGTGHLIGLKLHYKELDFEITGFDHIYVTLLDPLRKTTFPVQLDEHQLRIYLDNLIHREAGIEPEEIVNLVQKYIDNPNLNIQLKGLNLRGKKIQITNYLEYEGKHFLKFSNLPRTVFVNALDAKQIEGISQFPDITRLEIVLAKKKTNLFHMVHCPDTELESLWTFYQTMGLKTESGGKAIVTIIEHIKKLKLAIANRKL